MHIVRIETLQGTGTQYVSLPGTFDEVLNLVRTTGNNFNLCPYWITHCSDKSLIVRIKRSKMLPAQFARHLKPSLNSIEGP
jgi:hypothetical protein